MNEHLEAIVQHNATISTAEARLEKAQTERARHIEARDALAHHAKEAGANAARLVALAAIGEGDEKSVSAAQAEAGLLSRRAEALEVLLKGFDEIESTSRADAAAAREARREATRAALEAHLETVAAEYRKNALAFIGSLRRVHALERLRGMLGDSRPIFASQTTARQILIPALNVAAFDGLRCGHDRSCMYSGLGELTDPSTSPQGNAIEAEIATLGKLGLEL